MLWAIGIVLVVLAVVAGSTIGALAGIPFAVGLVLLVVYAVRNAGVLSGSDRGHADPHGPEWFYVGDDRGDRMGSGGDGGGWGDGGGGGDGGGS